MRFLIVTSASRPNKLMPKYFNHLDIAGIPYKCYPNQMTHAVDGTIGSNVEAWRRYALENVDQDRLILTDAWDVMTWATKEEVEERLSWFPPEVVFAAERNCWPEPQAANWIDHESPWRFINGGMLTGPPEKIVKWCDQVVEHKEYAPNMIGQQWLNRRLADKTFPVLLDRKTNLFYCMHLEKDELQRKDGKMWNSVLDSYPLFVHFNGNWPWGEVIQRMEGK